VSNEPAPLPQHRREATLRALVAGAGIGLLLAAGNVYTGLKTGFIDGGSITAALVAFILFSGTRRAGNRPYGMLENNITQTTAASAAIMGMVLGLSGPIPALGLLGRATPPGWALALWGLGASALGIGAAAILRRKLIVDEALAFPSGQATGEVIETIYTTRAAAMRRAKLLAGTAVAAFAITWFRDGTPKLIPQATAFGGTIAGVAVASLTLGMNWSPLLASTGAMIGPRAGISVLFGGAISWGVLAPWLLKAGIVREAAFGALSSWLVWPALGLLIAGSFVPLLLDVGMLRRTLRDLVALARGGSAGRHRAIAAERPLGAIVPLFLGGVVILLLVGRSVFGIGSGALIATIVIALLLTNVSARATGETDVAPVGAVGNLTQIAFAGAGAATSLLTGAASSASSAQASVMLYAFRAGERLGASPRPQIAGQLLGAALGAAVVVPVYLIVVKAYGVGTEALPASSAQSWKAMAEAIQGGAAALPPRALLAGGLGLATGIVIALAARTRVGRFLPSPAAMGMAMLIPGSYALAIFAGAMAVVAARRVRADLSGEAVLTAAAGGMAGESLAGVIVAFLSALGIL
jgi:uncharacterized oligopeptide transporter (OPT) family protein